MSSDSTLSAVTYTSSPKAAPQAPPSPDYVPGPEHPPSPDYVPGLEYPEYLAPSNNDILIEYQPLLVDSSPTALSPCYIADLDHEEVPKDDPKEDPADYPANIGDEEEDDDEEENKNLSLADSFTIPIDDPVPSAKDTEAFETDESAPTPPPPRLRRARISIPSPPLPLPSPPTHTSPTYAEAPLGYRATMIRARAASPLPLPAPSSPLEDVPEADVPPQKRLCLTAPTPRFEVGESSAAAAARQPGLDVTHATNYGFVDTMDATPRRPMSREVGYRITNVWDDMVGDMEETSPTTLEAVNQRLADLTTTLAQDTHATYVRFEDAQDDRAFLRAQINMIRRDRWYFNTMMLVFEREVMYAPGAWADSEDKSAAIEAHVRTLETQVATLMAQTSSLQIQLTTTLGRIQTLEAREPARTDDPKDVDSSAYFYFLSCHIYHVAC
ncbi:hypothetical protein Tco_0837670 [Tanacetum coccineum]